MSDQRPIRLLLANGQPLLRAGLRTVLGAERDLDVVAEAGDGVEAVELARRLQPDIVLMDVLLPRLDGVAATRAILAAGSAGEFEVRGTRIENGPARAGSAGWAVRVLIVTDDTSDKLVVGALRAGASGFVSIRAGAADLAAAVRAVAAGEAVLDPRILRRLLDRWELPLVDRWELPLVDRWDLPAESPPAAGGAAGQVDGLTGREREVLVHLARGLSNGEIADRLKVSETTVKTHVGNLLTKLGLRDRVQAVVFAYESGLVRPQG